MRENIYIHYEDVEEIEYKFDCIKDTLSKICNDFGFFVSEANYIFCSDEYLLQVNKEYLDHDYYTDIITFDNSEEKKSIETDIFISIERVSENASEQDVSFEDELTRVMSHGMLHLVGFKDKTDEEAKEMRNQEDKYLSFYESIS